MDKKKLKAYQANKRLRERNKKKIEDEQFRDIAVVMGKVKGSSHEFPYTEQRFSVQMNEPVESDRSQKRIKMWQQEITRAEQDIDAVEQFVSGIEDVRDKEILTYRFIDGMKAVEVAKKMGYTKGRISQIISNLVKD